ncbi:NB-ARC and TPR repeat-containing protein-likely pseudogene [Ectocarpus siliculosus]|nr:NB-ARC and TPR repeat-containing protein-likely pseudogene [Ectocarpus siliculosus]|eukprot:CBJ25719.1 NB-ARC and TPR repeat-containing protein-likely pseudogene [Ectocarpus siliculosus]
MATATVGVLNSASVGPLVPVCQAFKGLIEAVEGAAESHDKLKRLISRCAFLTTVLIQHDRAVGPLAQVQKPIKDFVATTNDLAAFAAKWAKGSKWRAIFVHRSDRSTLTDFEEGLRIISNDIALVDGLEHHQLLLAVYRQLRPPTLPAMASVPRGAISLTDGHISRPSLLGVAIGYLTSTAVGDAPCVLTGMAGAGKSVLASAVVRDEKVREVGRDAKNQLHDWLEGLALRVASTSGTTAPGLGSVEEVTRYLKAVCADAVSPRLVVLDDVWEREVVDTLKLTGLQLLVTTRDRSVVSMPGECVEVGDMQEDEALEVLRVGCGASKSLELPRAEALQAPGAAKTFAAQLVNQSMLQPAGDAFRVHDVVLLFLKPKLKADRSRPIATSRIAEYLGQLNVLRRYVENGEKSDGVYSLMALWRSVEDLVGENQVAAVYTKNLQGVPERAPWRQAGRVLHLMGKHEEAEPLYQRSLAICETSFGPDHPTVAAALNNLAVMLENQGKYAEADPLCLRAIEIGEETLSPDHPSLATRLNNRAALLQAQGKYAEADPLYLRAIEVGEKTLGPDHPDLATRLSNRAGLLEAQVYARPLFGSSPSRP